MAASCSRTVARPRPRRSRLVLGLVLATGAMLLLSACQKGRLESVAHIDAGSSYACALQDNGALWCWGIGSSGRLGNGTTDNKVGPTRVPGTWTQFSTGASHACAVASDATAWCWGSASWGKLGNGTSSGSQLDPVPVIGLTGVTQVAAGTDHSCAVLADASAWCWGNGGSGRLGNGDTSLSTTPVAVVGTPAAVGVEQISVGQSHSCAVLLDGTAWCWGGSSSGGLGDGISTSASTPVAVALASPADRVAQISAGQGHTCAIDTDSTLWCWGFNNLGQVGDGSTTNRHTPVEVTGLGGTPLQVSAGSQFTCATLQDGMAACWGRNPAGQLGNGTTSTGATPSPVPVSANYAVTAVTAGFDHACGIYDSGLAGCWGDNQYGQLGNSTTLDELTASIVGHPVDFDQAYNWFHDAPEMAITSGSNHHCVQHTGNYDSLLCWGANGTGQLGRAWSGSDEGLALAVPDMYDMVTVAAGGQHTCAAMHNRSVWCWGRNTEGQLGDGTTSTSRATPQPIAGFTLDARRILVAGNQHTCGVAHTGVLHCWGANSNGQLGDGTTTLRSTPTPVSGLGGVASVALGGEHSCAVLTNLESMRCWGANTSGQLGDATTTPRTTPVAVAWPFTDQAVVLQMVAGSEHTCALGDFFVSTEVSCWGRNNHGQLGDGTTTNASGGNPVPGLSTVTHLAAGRAHTCATDQDSGDAWCWGTNGGGQLGDGTTTTPRLSPVAVDFDLPLWAISIGATSDTTCAIGGQHPNDVAGSGTVYCWGSNSGGALGRNHTSTASTYPKPGPALKPPAFE